MSMQYAPSTRPLSVPRGASPAELLAAIRARYGGNAIVEASFGTPRPGWDKTEDGKPLPAEEAAKRERTWVNFVVRAPSTGAAVVRPVWEGKIVGGALWDAVHAAGHEREISYNISVRLPSGETLPNMG
ncbi:MAG: hypothetical protein M3M94_05500, partial [Actinomycetota bacterium]|nr:hypothetical protein [Actinomycetota bacterium]